MEVGVSNECWAMMVKHLHMNKFDNSGAGVWSSRSFPHLVRNSSALDSVKRIQKVWF